MFSACYIRRLSTTIFGVNGNLALIQKPAACSQREKYVTESFAAMLHSVHISRNIFALKNVNSKT